MNTSELKRNNKRKRSVQVGRGGTRGKTSGRGHKGQKARAGRSIRPEIRDRIKKIPKLRGRGVNSNTSIKQPFAVVKLSELQSNFKSGDNVTPQSVLDAGLVRKVNGKIPPIKIIASGELKDKLIIKKLATTKASKEAIEKVGGQLK